LRPRGLAKRRKARLSGGLGWAAAQHMQFLLGLNFTELVDFGHQKRWGVRITDRQPIR